MTVEHEKNATRRKCNLERVQQKQSSMKLVQHRKRVTRKECKMKKECNIVECNMKRVQQEKIPT